MDKKLKIGLLLTGGLRNFEDTYSSFKHFLLDVFDVDVFFYGLENKLGKYNNEISLVKTFNPVSYVINDKSYYDNINVKKSYIKSSYFSFYNVLKCNDLRKQYEEEKKIKYDILIRCRLDVFWFRGITEHEIEMGKNMILTPKEWSFKEVNNFALSDIFCITNSLLMDKYCELYKHIDRYCESIDFHPESICGYHIQVNNLPHKEISRHFIFEYPDKKQYEYIPENCYFIKHFDGENKNRKDFDLK